jgi:ATP-dependent DNA helicase PIF1
MDSKNDGNSPASGFELDRIMAEDVMIGEDATREHKRVWNEDVKIAPNAVKADGAGLGHTATDEDQGPGSRSARTKDKADKAVRKAKSHARLPEPHVRQKEEPLRTVHNEENRSKHLEDNMQAPSKKRNWDKYRYEKLLQKPLQNNNETAQIPVKEHSPIEVITLSSSDDELAKPNTKETPTCTGRGSVPWLEKRSLDTGVVDLVSTSDVHGFEAAQSTPGPTPLPSHIPVHPTVEPPLCREQAALVDLILSGRNVFYTGSAGCGKSTVLKAFVKRLKEHPMRPKKVDIIAPTGRAALDINGSTFWTYAGWTPDHMKKPIQDLRKAAHAKFVKKRLRETDVLVIDEVSMMENHHFERLNQVMKEARGNERPFGGVQLVVTGDFCQLPPVKPFQFCLNCGTELQQDASGTLYTCTVHGTFLDSDKWAFLSTAWEGCRFEHVNLTNIHRQSDEIFIAILQKCRLGIPLSPKDEDLLLNHDSQTGNAVRLFPTREEVRVVNKTAFDRLPTQKRAFRCYDDFRCNSTNLQSKERRSEHDDTLIALRDHRFDPCIELKQGMQVVLLVNLDIKAGLVNGSQGVVTGFENADPAKLPKAKEDGKAAQNYSSVPTLNGEHADVREANIRTFMDRAATKELPIVLFQNRVTQTILPDCRVSELGDQKPYSLLSRTQIPLVAGWAMTVHKSQGMTLNRVVVNLSKSFEEGQSYVALSRARSLEGLKVEGLGRQQGRNEQVRRFLWDKFGIR